jgi:pyruvate dehydrogenase (quinone)
MESVADLAIRTALSARGSRTSQSRAGQVQEVKKGRSEHNPSRPERLPARIELEHAADILNHGERVMTGERDLHAKEDLEEVVGTPIV